MCRAVITLYAVLTELCVLFCADPLTPTRADEHFAAQAAMVRDLGGQIALIDHDALVAGHADSAVRRVPRGSGPWWYRGWMIPAAAYTDLAKALGRREAGLRVPPRRFRSAHELPGWYGTFAEVTPESHWMDWASGRVPDEAQVSALTGSLGSGAAIVKDFVKSCKHEWDQACFIPDVTDIAHATAVVARMVQLQEDTRNGGIVLRRFEDYTQHDGRAVEARVWWVDGVPVMVTAHPDTPGIVTQPPLDAIGPLVSALGCPFVTTDLAQRTDGRWRVVEVGDGQVSDLPAGADPAPLFEQLAKPTTIDAPPLCPHCAAPGTPILFGLPTDEARQAAAHEELVLRGCLAPDDPPQWTCEHGHEWATTEPHWAAAIAAVINDSQTVGNGPGQ